MLIAVVQLVAIFAVPLLILRLRDNCAAFDPLERAKMIRQEDPVSNIGLRIVLGISRDVRYQNLLGTNVLTLRL